MKLNPLIFRKYDIRGVADRDLTPEVVNEIGRAYGTYIKRCQKKKAFIGMDARLSSSRIKRNLIAGITSTGIDIIDLGLIPTPVLYFAINYYEEDSGVMVTGSHNPKEYNGLKLCVNKTSIYGEEIQKLKEMIEKEDFEKGEGKIEQRNPIPDYLKYLQTKFKFKKRFRIAVDPGNGAVGVLIERLFSSFGFDVKYINLKPDGNFPVHLPDPTIPKFMEELSKIVKEEKRDIGIGYDGDGDRIGIIDEEGNLIYGDRLLALLASEVLEKNPGAKIIFDVKCSEGIVEYIKKKDGIPIMYKTGHSLLKAKMREENAPMAGEMSGHIFFKDEYFGFDDAIYASLRVLRIMDKKEKKITQLLSEIPSYISTPEIRIACPDKIKFDVVERLKKEFEGFNVITIDGLRVVTEKGWGLVRASNTQPVLVLRFEAKKEKDLEDIKNLFYEKLKKIGVEPKEVI